MLNIVSRYTSLGDMAGYIDKDPYDIIARNGSRIWSLRRGLPLIRLFGSLLYQYLNESLFLTNLVFCVLGYIGVIQILKVLPLKKDATTFAILLIIFSPSFNMWSSLAGKEAVIVFFSGIILNRVIINFSGDRLKLDIPMLISLYFFFLIKPQYFPAVMQLVVILKVIDIVKPGKKVALALILLTLAANVGGFYHYKDRVDGMVVNLDKYFSHYARSTRQVDFETPEDFYRNLPAGIVVSFWGPTISETRISFLHLFSFIESFIIFISLLVLIRRQVCDLFHKKGDYVRVFIILLAVFWLLVPQYMQGYFNPGSAIRYRTNILLFITVLPALSDRKLFVHYTK